MIHKEQIANFERRYRATMINSLAGIRQSFLVGSKSKLGIENVAIFSNIIHFGANPPLWGIVFRPDTIQRDTLNNILETNCYTLNYINQDDFEKAHQTSAKFESHISEFESCGFEAQYVNDFFAPFVASSPIKIGLKFAERIDISINNTIIIIGQIETIDIDLKYISEDGFVNLHQLDVLANIGLDAYCHFDLKQRLSYAKSNVWPTPI
jgi:flavin reductase (DIM6/NTAB) family NADH-FMN oxidoreductase RutF